MINPEIYGLFPDVQLGTAVTGLFVYENDQSLYVSGDEYNAPNFDQRSHNSSGAAYGFRSVTFDTPDKLTYESTPAYPPLSILYFHAVGYNHYLLQDHLGICGGGH